MTPPESEKSPEPPIRDRFRSLTEPRPAIITPANEAAGFRRLSFFRNQRPAAQCKCHRTFVAEGSMANTKSAKKKTRVIERRTKINQHRRSMMRGFIRKVEEAIAGGDQNAALAALKSAEPQIMRASQKGIVHKKTASRKVSRLTARVAKLASA
jgi:small subunit ribosomal protein S20